MDRSWKTIKSECLVDTPWVRFYKADCILPNGKGLKGFYWEHRPECAIIVAVTTDRKILMTWQYRHGIKKVIPDLPGGNVKSGEDILAAAKRELQEETGYTSDRWEKLFDIPAGGAEQDRYIHAYLALDCKKVQEQHLDATEDVVYKEISLDDALKIADEGQTHGFCVAALYKAFRRLGI